MHNVRHYHLVFISSLVPPDQFGVMLLMKSVPSTAQSLGGMSLSISLSLKAYGTTYTRPGTWLATRKRRLRWKIGRKFHPLTFLPGKNDRQKWELQICAQCIQRWVQVTSYTRLSLRFQVSGTPRRRSCCGERTMEMENGDHPNGNLFYPYGTACLDRRRVGKTPFLR